MLKNKVSVVSPPIYREHERVSLLVGPNLWITLVVVALFVPAAADAKSSEKPADDRVHSAQPTLQLHRPSYLLRDRTGTELAPIIPVDFPFARRPELRFTEKAADKPVGSPPAAQNVAFPKQVLLPATAVVLLRLKSGKVTSRHKPGHRVLFEVEADVRSGSSTCIARGTPVYGVVGSWTLGSWGVLGKGRLEVELGCAGGGGSPSSTPPGATGSGCLLAPIIPVDFPFARRPELRFTEKAADKPVGSPPAAQNVAFPKQVLLPATAVVLLRLKSGKVTSRHKPGHRVLFEVEADVRSGSSTCIARGTPESWSRARRVYGVVGSWTLGSWGVLGKGRLEVEFEGVPVGAGRQAPLHRCASPESPEELLRRPCLGCRGQGPWMKGQHSLLDWRRLDTQPGNSSPVPCSEPTK